MTDLQKEEVFDYEKDIKSKKKEVKMMEKERKNLGKAIMKKKSR